MYLGLRRHRPIRRMITRTKKRQKSQLYSEAIRIKDIMLNVTLSKMGLMSQKRKQKLFQIFQGLQFLKGVWSQGQLRFPAGKSPIMHEEGLEGL